MNGFYHKNLMIQDVRKLLFRKFYKVHDMKLINISNTSHLKVYYRKPEDPEMYERELETLTKIINTTESSEFFIKVIGGCQKYPSFVLLDGDVIDIPICINLHLDP